MGTQGRILLDGRPLPQYDVHYLRRKIAVVAQDNVLFDTTIRENVAYGMHPAPTDAEVCEALRRSSAMDFVQAFPDKIFSFVGSRGLSLSGGQRQRVAIARAMVRAPQILILDEATSALDPANEKVVQHALDSLIETTRATALVIAHRLTTIRDCDKIIVFDEGRVVEQGTHDELLEIPVVRHAPRGEHKEGAIKSGYYHCQWNNMMGTKKGAVACATLSHASTTGESIDGKDAEICSLKAQLAMAQRELAQEKRWNLVRQQHLRFEQPLLTDAVTSSLHDSSSDVFLAASAPLTSSGPLPTILQSLRPGVCEAASANKACPPPLSLSRLATWH